MANGVNIIEEKSRLQAMMRFVYFLFVGVLSFFALTAICFGILDLSCRAGFMAHYENLHVDWQSFIFEPSYIFDLYAGWWNDLLSGIEQKDVRIVLFFNVCGSRSVWRVSDLRYLQKGEYSPT